MSDTPRTDDFLRGKPALCRYWRDDQISALETFARELERENAALLRVNANLTAELEDWKETAQVHLEAARAMATELTGVKTALGLDGASYEPDLPLAVKARMDLLRALAERKGMPLPP